MICRALDAGIPAAWVTGDAVYGANPGLRAEVEARGVGYVVAVACDHRVVAAGHTYRVDALVARVPARRGSACRPVTAPGSPLALLVPLGQVGDARHAFLVVAALTDQARNPAPSGLVRLTCNEVQHLFAALVAQAAGDVRHRLRWSLWRRRHQARARTCHYRRQAAQDHDDRLRLDEP